MGWLDHVGHDSEWWLKMIMNSKTNFQLFFWYFFESEFCLIEISIARVSHSWAPRTNGGSWTIPLNILRLYFCGFMYGWFVPWWWPIQIINIYGWYYLYVVGLVVDCLILMISMVYNSGSCRSRMDMFGIFVYLRYTLGIWLFIIPKCKTHME